MGLLSSLYRYKQSSSRGPLEDFLTEVLCYLLNELNTSKLTPRSVNDLFNIPDWHNADIFWRTQYVINSPGTSPDRKRPDIVGIGRVDGQDAFVILENKIWASQTSYEDLNTHVYREQLALYDDYLQSQLAPIKELCLLTYGTPPPVGWQNRTAYWYNVDKNVKRWAKEDSFPIIAARLCDELHDFLRENGMGLIKLELTEIASMAPSKKLGDACKALGIDVCRPVLESHPCKQKLIDAGILEPNGLSYGPFKLSGANNFRGAVMTAGKQSADSARVIVWIGVLIDAVHDVIRPKKENIPELNAGIGVWVDKKEFVNAKPKFAELKARLNANRDTRDWNLESDIWPSNPDEGYFVISKDYTFLEMYGAEDWNETAKAFCKDALDDISALSPEDLRFIANWKVGT